MTSIVFFIEHILVVVEGFLVELSMTINKKVRNWAHLKSSMIERGDPLCRFFTQPQTCRFSRFFQFVAVRSYTADSCLLQRCVWTPHLTRRSLSLIHRHMRGSKLRVCRAHIMCHPHVFVMTLFDYSLSFLCSPSSLLSSCPSSCPSTSSSTMWWTNSLCSS